LDLYFKSLTQPPGVLDWDWAELEALIQAYAQGQCSNSSTNTSAPTSGGAIWPHLNLPWAFWNSTAQSSPNPSNWTTAEWKEWILWYVEYFNALQIYLGDAASNSSGNSTPGTGNSSSGLVALLNFTAIWSPLYDSPAVPVAVVVADLNATSSIIVATLSWFNSFFGPTGLVTLSPPLTTTVPSNQTTGNQSTSNQTTSNTTYGVNIPPGLEAIVEWITSEV